MTGVGGTLLSQFFLRELLFTSFAGQLGEKSLGPAVAAFNRWWLSFSSTSGPASSVRALWDRGGVPALALLGYRSTAPSRLAADVLAAQCHTAGASLDVLVGPWGEDLAGVWRAASRHSGVKNRWCVCFNGVRLRVVDATRVYSDRHLEFDLETLAADQREFAVLWAVLRASAFQGDPRSGSLFERLISTSAAHAVQVNNSLQHGVLDSLSELLTSLVFTSRGPSRGRARTPTNTQLALALQDSLTVVYRVLFLLFAEARGLVPVWHPVYRDSYTIASLRTAIERPTRSRGLWESLRAIARLAREGCSAGDLEVTAFNGRLFARARIDSGPAPGERSLQRALLALSTTAAGPQGRQRIDYRDLGVEQLGSVYEGVLDYTPSWSGGPSPTVRMRKGSRERKTTGTFYTPRSITEYLVRQTLYPLVRDSSPADILDLRVLDPAMGSGAFLVAACRYLANVYEAALVREGECASRDLTEADRCTFRRTIAQRCLFGVDHNHMAVQLSRLSLWLATLAADRPLTFLDHHLRTGDSLLGATPDDLARRAPPTSALGRSKTRPATLPFFDDGDLEATLRSVLPNRFRIATEPGDTVPAIREKERLLAHASGARSALQRWRAMADLWCACWFWPDNAPPSRPLFAALIDHLTGAAAGLPSPQIDGLLEPARTASEHRQFFHWLLEFPEAFFETDGHPRAAPGFDAVVGNPPWEMLRADPGTSEARRTLAQKTRFIKDSGAYRHQSPGQINLYQAFLERAVQLTRQGGRLGVALPSGLLTDQGATPLRRLVLQRCDTDSLILMDNHDRVFPIHRGVKFALMTTTKGNETREVRYRTGLRDPTVLDAVHHDSSEFFRFRLAPRFLERLSGSTLAVPDLRSIWEVRLLDRMTSRFTPLGAKDGWNLSFGRELNATDDSGSFTDSGSGLLVLEGKHVTPFRVHVDQCHRRISGTAPGLRKLASHRRSRLAYREVASATNRLTLIAAVVPARAVTTHTLFCLKTLVPATERDFLCGMLNSFVANFLVRLFVTTHVTAGVIARLFVPRLDAADRRFRDIAALSRRLTRSRDTWAGDYARLQALAARAYELTAEEFEHVLGTFPLVAADEKDAALRYFGRT